MSVVHAGSVLSAEQQRRVNSRTWVAMYLGVLAVSALLGLITMVSAPTPLALPLTMLLLTIVVVATKPIVGLYAVAFFTLFTDGQVSGWYPFVKNMSSRESILYLSNGLFVSPLELILAVTATAWLLRLLIDRGARPLVRATLFRPLVVFSAFLFFGFVLGIATGGDRYVALWEFRPIAYLPITYVLLTNLFTTRRQYHRLAAVMLGALVIHALLGMLLLFTKSAAERDSMETLVGHGSAVQMSVVIIAALAVWLLPGAPRSMRWLVPLAVIPVAWVWLISQRRAAVVALAVAIILLGLVLAKLNPQRLRRIAPVVALLTVAYLGAFWNSHSLLGFPADALKSVISPDQVSDKDQSSDLYRSAENYDISATIRAKPLTGLGFGQKFYRPAPLPDISFFPFYEFMPHNSVLWMWIKTGIGGFIAMLFVFGSAVRTGIRTILRLDRGRDVVLAFAALSYVVMYLVYAYVDVAWDARSMITLAVAMAICSDFLRIPEDEPGAQSSGRARTAPARPSKVAAT